MAHMKNDTDPREGISAVKELKVQSYFNNTVQVKLCINIPNRLDKFKSIQPAS